MPDAVTWQPHTLSLPDLDLAWCDAGNGPTVIFLHGGPGDDSSYLRPVAAPLTDRFRCVLLESVG